MKPGSHRLPSHVVGSALASRWFFGIVLVLLCTALAATPAVAQSSDRQQTSTALTEDTQDRVRDVTIALYLADLIEIDGSRQSFQADVMMVATWTDPTLAGTFDKARTVKASEVWQPTLLILNQRAISRSLPEVVTVDPAGGVRYAQRFTGTFSAVMDLRSFPRDRQRLAVWVVAPVRMGEPVRLLADDSLAALRNDSLSISDWRVGELELVQRDFLATANATPAPGIELSVGVERRVVYYVIQVLVPLLTIMLMPWAVFWIAPSIINTRVSVSVTTMLTLIAYRFALGNHVPRLSYLTRLDWFLLGATALVMLTLATVAFSAHLIGMGREEQVQRINRVGRILYPMAVTVLTLAIWFSH